jgi:hypothetical protein
MRKEFQTHTLTTAGLGRVEQVREAFSELLVQLEELVPTGRELSTVKTKLEEAAFFAVRGIAVLSRYQV